jgi:curli biogenesis system outer membrane secretion channel CsgG
MNTPRLTFAFALCLAAGTGVLAQTTEQKKPATEPPRFRTLLAPGAAAPAGEETRRLKVAVLDFFERSPYSGQKGSLGQATSTALSAELEKTGRFDLSDRKELEATLAELSIPNGSLVNEQAALRVGKLAKADYVVFGDIEKLQVERSQKAGTQTAKVTLNYRILSVESGRVWKTRQLAGSAVGAGTDDSREVTERAIFRTIEDFLKTPIPEPLGKVALVDTERGQFAINLGLENGVDKGTYFQVVRLGREIRDPDTGKVIEREKEVICWGKVVTAADKTSWLEPGEYARNDLGVVRWKGRKSKLDELRVGDTVQVVEGKRTLY